MAKKYYAVRVGKVPGIYLTWDDCKAMVDGYPGAKYKSFGSIAEAEASNRAKKELDEIKKEIIKFFVENRTNISVTKPILGKCNELGYANPNEISSIEDAKTIFAMTLQ